MSPEGMITKKIGMENIVEEGFQALIHDKVGASELSCKWSGDGADFAAQANQVKILVDLGAQAKN